MPPSKPKQPAQTEASTAKPQGLLSFLYNSTYDPATTQQAQTDPQGTLLAFGIDPSQPVFKVLINVQNAGSASDALDPTVFATCISLLGSGATTQQLNSLIIAQALGQELSEDYEIIW